ncbi:Hypothetical protein SCF082_LOCUS11069 [Durusdinium trenchii]|uniref:SGNH hydrolase-type esterase domain-containing protein n=1 Tax=Durusdinium trenchii TaxID=1381693 RepID=A0ABP0JAF3_9DINO
MGQSSKSCSLFDVTFEPGFTYAWVSIGGNDFFEMACSMDVNRLTSVQQSIEQVLADLQFLSANTKIILTGYAVPKGPLTWHPSPACSSITALEPLNAAVKRAAQAWGATFVDVSESMGGNTTHWSQTDFFRDSIHLNAAGYTQLWSTPALQEAFQCVLSNARAAGILISFLMLGFAVL